MSHQLTKFELKRVIKELKPLRGRHTELVSVYVPGDYNLNEIVSFLTTERSEAENIKSKTTRKNVQGALEKIQRRLREVNKNPENGVVLFCGNVSELEGKTNMKMWEIVPPVPVTSRIYRCDKTFVLEPLKDMVEEKKVYGLISIDRQEGTVAFLKGKSIEIIKTLDSNVPGKIKAGGQSQQRFARNREGLYLTFLSQIAETCQTAFLELLRTGKMMGIIVAGPGFAKDDVVDDHFHGELKDKVIARISTNYAGEDGINEMMDKLKEVLVDSEIAHEKSLVSEFFESLKKGDGKNTYGLIQTIRALEMGAVKKLLVSETLEIKRMQFKCGNCGHVFIEYIRKDKLSKINKKPCSKCGSDTVTIEIDDLLEYLEEKTEEMGSSLHIISTETQEGKRLEQLGGIAAILRYKL